MTVRAEKPSVNLREKLAELDKPTGIAGEAMLRAETPQEQFNLIGAGRRNFLINGAMEVAQRGTTFDCNAGSGQNYTVDRWFVQSDINFTATQGTATLPNGNSVKTLKVTADSAQTVWADPYQMIEDYKPLDGQLVTMSAWVRTNIQGIVLRKYSDKNLSDEVTPDGEWHYITATFVPDFSGGAVRSATGSAVGVTFKSNLSVAQDDYFEFTQVQLELGKVATPFEHRSYGEELALCQRYYYQVGKESGDYMSNACFARNGYLDLVYGTVNFPTELRTTPTVGYGGNLQGITWTGGYETKTTTGPVTGDNTGKRTGGIRVEFPTDWTAGDEVFIVDNDGTGFISFDAEL
jgi:hypothetical protein